MIAIASADVLAEHDAPCMAAAVVVGAGLGGLAVRSHMGGLAVWPHMAQLPATRSLLYATACSVSSKPQSSL